MLSVESQCLWASARQAEERVGGPKGGRSAGSRCRFDRIWGWSEENVGWQGGSDEVWRIDDSAGSGRQQGDLGQ